MIWRRGAAPPAVSGDLPEVVALIGTGDAAAVPDTDAVARLELYREFAHPPPGCPPLCLVSATAPPLAEDQEVAWSLAYRLIPPPE